LLLLLLRLLLHLPLLLHCWCSWPAAFTITKRRQITTKRRWKLPGTCSTHPYLLLLLLLRLLYHLSSLPLTAFHSAALTLIITEWQ
jgi:hypothetical protein